MEHDRSTRVGAEVETVDVGELARAMRRGWRGVVAGGVIGLAVAAALVLFFPWRYPGAASVLLRNANDPTGSLLSRFGIAGDIAGGGGGALGNVLKSPMETEVQLLGSRDVLGDVVDSLGLQARVLAPRRTPARTLIEPASYPGSFKRTTFSVERQPDGAYRVTGADTTVVARPGQPARLPVVGPVTLARGRLPAHFKIKFEDRADAITRLTDRLDIEKAGGEVAELDYSGPDSLTAAEVPNAVIATYLKRRRTTDRGMNQRRLEFLLVQNDTVTRSLALAEGALRRDQERSGVFDPELAGKGNVDALLLVQEQLGAVDAERLAIAQVVSQVERGALAPRELGASPSMLKSPAINGLLTQIAALETERTRLLERRTPRDPEILSLTQSIAQVESQFLPYGRTYARALDRQATELRRQHDELQARMAALPGQAEGNLRWQREVKRLSQTSLALQAQILDARLAAIAEGGQVRQIDVAQPAKRPRFPRPVPTLVVGVILGLLAGAVWAATRGAITSRIMTSTDVERVTGFPSLELTSGRPLLLGSGARRGTVLVTSVGSAGHASAVARQLAEHASERGQRVGLLDLTGAHAEASPAAVARLADGLESENELTVVAVPGLDDRRAAVLLEPSRAVLLVGRTGKLRRAQLAESASTLVRLGVPVLGVVLVDHEPAARDPLPAAGPGMTARADRARGDAGAAAGGVVAALGRGPRE